MLNQIREKAERPNTERRSDASAAAEQWRCEQLNGITEKMPEISGFSCTACGDIGGKYEIINGSYISWTPCPHCSNIRKGFYLLKKSGLADKTFDSFKTTAEWQKGLLGKVSAYTSSEDCWLYMGGQSGCGKTHLCTAAVRELLLSKNVSAKLFKWVEDARLLKALVNDSGYISEIDRFRTVAILYIDDLFKGGVTAADLKLAYDILDYRYRHKLRTIISSEMFLDEIIGKDEALGGRIKEMSEGFSLNITRDKGKNYRL